MSTKNWGFKILLIEFNLIFNTLWNIRIYIFYFKANLWQTTSLWDSINSNSHECASNTVLVIEIVSIKCEKSTTKFFLKIFNRLRTHIHTYIYTDIYTFLHTFTYIIIHAYTITTPSSFDVDRFFRTWNMDIPRKRLRYFMWKQ